MSYIKKSTHTHKHTLPINNLQCTINNMLYTNNNFVLINNVIYLFGLIDDLKCIIFYKFSKLMLHILNRMAEASLKRCSGQLMGHCCASSQKLIICTCFRPCLIKHSKEFKVGLHNIYRTDILSTDMEENDIIFIYPINKWNPISRPDKVRLLQNQSISLINLRFILFPTASDLL